MMNDAKQDDAKQDDAKQDDAKPGISRRTLALSVLASTIVAGVGGFFGGRQYTLHNLRRRRRPRVTWPAFVPIEKWSARRGATQPKVTLVSFSDFQCPFCGRVANTLDRLLKEYPDDVQVVVRHQPLGFHKRAEPAARAMQAAHRQGKAWLMHDHLFKKRKALSDEDLANYASELGLDVERFKKDYADPEIANQVKADKKYALSILVTGTPCTFVNGERVAGARDYDFFKSLVDKEIDAADKALASGTPHEALYKTLATAKVAKQPRPKSKAK